MVISERPLRRFQPEREGTSLPLVTPCELAGPYVPVVLTASAPALMPGTEPVWLVPAGDAEGSLGKCGLHLDWLSEAQGTEMAGEGGLCACSGGWGGQRVPFLALGIAMTLLW